jgi:hypothetical protein
MGSCKRTPDIDYPCRWTYRIIGKDEGALRSLVAALLEEREHYLELSNRSRGGRYTSLRLQVTVSDEADRKGLFASLSSHSAVKIVL